MTTTEMQLQDLLQQDLLQKDAPSVLAALDQGQTLRSWREIGHELTAAMQMFGQAGRETDADLLDRERCAFLLTIRASISHPEAAEAGRFTGIVGFSNGHVWPDPDAFSEEEMLYFRDRAAVTTNPVMRTRYYDLLFEKSRLPRKHEFALVAIDDYLGSARLFLDSPHLSHQIEMVSAMDQAAYLSLKVQSLAKINEVVSRLDDLIGRLSEGSAAKSVGREGSSPIGRWSLELSRILFHIRRSKKFGVAVSDETLERVQQRMTDLAQRNGEVGLNHLQAFFLEVATEAARLLGNEEAVFELHMRDAEALVQQAETRRLGPSPGHLVAAKFLEDAVRQYQKMRETLTLSPERRADLDSREAALKGQIRQMYREGRQEMATFAVPVEIPAEELEQMVDEILAPGTLAECLRAIATEGALLPDLAAAIEDAKNTLAENSLMSILPKRTIRDDMTIAEARTDQERLTNEIERNLLLWIEINSSVVLPALFRRLREGKGLTAETLSDYLAATGLFEEGTLAVLRVGLDRFFEGDLVSVIHILVPQFEDVLRSLVEKFGGGIIRPRFRQGGWEFETFGAFLRQETVKQALPPEMLEYIRLVMTEQVGWNLRNRIAHGLIRLQDCTEATALTVVHLFLLLTLFQKQDAVPADPQTLT